MGTVETYLTENINIGPREPVPVSTTMIWLTEQRDEPGADNSFSSSTNFRKLTETNFCVLKFYKNYHISLYSSAVTYLSKQSGREGALNCPSEEQS